MSPKPTPVDLDKYKCFLVKHSGYLPFKRCRLCNLRLRECFSVQISILSLIVLIFVIILGSIRHPWDISLYTVLAILGIIALGVITNKKTDDMVNTLYKLKKDEETLALIYEVGQEIASTLDIEEVLRKIVEGVANLLDVEICSVLLFDEVTKTLKIKAAKGLDEKIIKTTEIERGENISGWVFSNQQAILVEDIENDPRFNRKNKEKYYTKTLLSVPLIAKEKVIGVINANNKRSHEPFSEEDLSLLKGISSSAAIAIENAKLHTDLENFFTRAIKVLTMAIDAKDHYTSRHSEQVTKYALAIAEEMQLSGKEIEEIHQACQLHDIGKIGIPDYILTKPGKLNDEEWKEIKQHSNRGAEILEPLAIFDGVIDLIKQHHERFDGKGYPFGKKGEDIKLGARIMAVADSFDAMLSDRPYHSAFSKQEAMEELKRCSGTQFDPEVVKYFLKVLEKNPDIIKD